MFNCDKINFCFRALPNAGEYDFQVPPGMSLKSYKRLVEKNQINPEQLEEVTTPIILNNKQNWILWT